MSQTNRFLDIVSAKINKLLGRIEDPRELLDNSYEKQKELLIKVKKGITELTTSKNQLITQKITLEKEVTKLTGQAQLLSDQGDDALATAALERKSSTQSRINSLTTQIEGLNKEQERLTKASRVLEMKIEQLKSEKESLKASYTAAEASVKINESLSGMGDELGNIGTAVDKAKSRTDEMNARSRAIGDLTESGVLSSPLDEGTNIDRELERCQMQGEASSELKAMKRKTMIKNNDLNFCKVK